MILEYSSINNSWLCGFIKSNFSKTKFVDAYFINTDIEPNLNNSIVYLDDEDPKTNEWVKSAPHKNFILICKIKSVYEKFKSLGYTCLYYPYWHIVDDTIALRKLKNIITINKKASKDFTFCCLNRNHTPSRNFLIQQLVELDLIKYGFVTYINSQKIHDNLEVTPDMTHYKDNVCGFERHQYWQNDIGYSSNVANYFYIRENINAKINIAHETHIQPFFPTEKSFLAFFTGKIPIVLAEQGRIAELESQGFDVFRDIVDHSYDGESNHYIKITEALVKNRDILTRFDSDINKRTEYNYEYLINDWLDQKLLELFNGLNKLV